MVAYRIEIYDPDGRKGEEWNPRDRNYNSKAEAEEAFTYLMSYMSIGQARLVKVVEKVTVLQQGPDYSKPRIIRDLSNLLDDDND